MATSNSWNTILTANTEAHNGWGAFYETIVVENLDASAVVWIATDGSAATVGGADLDAVGPGETAVFSNRQPKLKAITSAPGSTAQEMLDPASGSLTFVSVISSGAVEIVVSPQ